MPKTQKKRVRRRGPRIKRLPKGPNGGIELLLIHTIEHLGAQGDVVEVKPGFANNYLIPQGLATVATEHHKRMVEKHRAKLKEVEEKRLKGLRDQASELGKLSITIEANANDDGQLYGSVGAVEIVRALKDQNVVIAQEQVRLEGPLKELGLYTVKVQLHSAVMAELKVWIVPAVDKSEDPA